MASGGSTDLPPFLQQREGEPERLTDKAFWTSYWNDHSAPNSSTYILPYQETLRKYLPKGGRLLEIGCAPGRALVTLHQLFGYDVTGLDFVEAHLTQSTLEEHHVPGRVIEADFTTADLHEVFDVVASFGFVEHFRDFGAVVRRQASLVAEGGTLLIGVPNIRYGNRLLYQLLAPALLPAHNPMAMDPRNLLRALSWKRQDWDVLFCDYVKTLPVYFDQTNPLVQNYPLRKAVVTVLRSITEFLKISNIPNFFFSPYILLIAKRRRRIALSNDSE